VSQQRARLFSLLRGLWQQLSIVHDSAPEESGPSNAPLERVRGLLDQINAEMGGHGAVLRG
jgi:hypothetical protein